MSPSPHAAAINAAMTQAATGRGAQAIASLQRLVQKSGGDPDLNHALGILLLKSDQAPKAQFYLERAAAIDPGRPAFHSNLGAALAAQRRWKDAIPRFRKAVELDPSNVPGWAGLTQALVDAQDFEGAAAAALEVVRLRPDLLDGYNNGALALASAGRIEEAVALAERGAAALPGNTTIHRTLMGLLAYTPAVEMPDFAARCRATGELLIKEAAAPMPKFDHIRDPDRRIRVGFLSPDLRRHSVSYFLEPILQHHDAARILMSCYMTSSDTDDVSARLRKLSDGWVDGSRLDAAALAQRISSDRIDVLIDLAGYSRGSRLGVMARRCAPVQATFLGWPTTTGLSTIDWRIVDSITDPPGSEPQSIEKLLRLDGCFLCYSPPAEAPEVSLERPPGAPITFGSFNVLTKVGEHAVSLWSRVLNANPGSRLMLKAAALGDPGSRARLIQRFERAGIGPDRLELVARTPGIQEHLALYSKVDIALDTTPYNGTTTTCEALWMGVPVVSLVGAAHAGRVGASLLHTIGLDQFACATPEDYVKTASNLAANASLRNSLRADLRPRLRASPLCDGPGYAGRFERGLREAWKAWCAAVPG